MELFILGVTPTTTISSTDEFWAAVFTIIGGAILTILTFFVNKLVTNVRDVKEKTEAINKKITSNHNNDNLGDKVDRFLDLAEHNSTKLNRVVILSEEHSEIIKELAEIVTKDHDRLNGLEKVMKSNTQQSAEAEFIVVSEMHEVKQKLDNMRVVEPTATIVPGSTPITYCRRKRHDDGKCRLPHRE